MHITFYKSGKIPIPPKLYGGTERIIYWLGKALVELGHHVTLIANAHSCIPGAELRVIAKESEDPQSCLRLIPQETDIVHFHEQPPGKMERPYVCTCHGNGRPGETFAMNTVFVSQRHAANHGSCHFVYNGIDASEYSCAEKREDYAVFLAKARWRVKNLPGAINVARRAEIKLLVMGSRNWPLNLQRLWPPIRGVRYLGMLGGAEKRELLSRARCLIFPACWEEPFGLAITEALVSGCYVVATPYGSFPEVITPGTGLLSARADELAEAVKNPQRFSPQSCRDRVLQGGFTHLDMARKYIECYERILAHGTLGGPGEPAPATRPGFIAKQLLPWED